MSAEDKAVSAEAHRNVVAFDYIKANDFRIVRADGAIGGITPKGAIHFALFSERHAIPRKQVFALNMVDTSKGKLGDEIPEKAETRGSIVREMSCDIFLTLEVAKSLADWLNEMVVKVNASNGEMS